MTVCRNDCSSKQQFIEWQFNEMTIHRKTIYGNDSSSKHQLSLGQVFVAVTKRESCIYFQRKLHLCAVSCIYAHIWLWKTWNNLFCMQKSKKLRKVKCKNRKSCKKLHAKIEKVAKSCNIKFLETAQNIQLYISWVFRKLLEAVKKSCKNLP